MNGYRKSYGRSAPRPARWMDLHYAGSCCVCGVAMPAGARGFYDPADRSVCCTSLDCAEAHGVTTLVWNGSPVSGGYVLTLSDHRLGAPATVAYGRHEVRDPGEDMADRWSESQ